MSDQVSAKVIAHSKAKGTGKEVVTFELEFPRIVLAEFNTHNALSKNSSSSRAIPVQTMLMQVIDDPAYPVRFGKKNKGMQDAGECKELIGLWNDYIGDDEPYGPHDAWRMAARSAAYYAQAFDTAGYAKQICNRLIEPFQRMKVVMTATELANFLWLRDHPAADPTIEALAKEIKKAYINSEAFELNVGEWHVPYVEVTRDFSGKILYVIETTKKDPDRVPDIEYDRYVKVLTVEEALMISASCAAQASYRKLDDSLEKAESVVNRLNLGIDVNEPMHVSPTEHQATPIAKPTEDLEVNNPFDPDTWQEGVTHVKKNGTLCSGNLEGWVQYRKLIKGNCYGEE